MHNSKQISRNKWEINRVTSKVSSCFHDVQIRRNTYRVVHLTEQLLCLLHCKGGNYGIEEERRVEGGDPGKLSH